MSFQVSAFLTALFQVSGSVRDLHTIPSLLIQEEVYKMSKSTSISYRQVGDYKIPNIILPPEQANITVGKRGERVPVALKQANRPSRQARHDA